MQRKPVFSKQIFKKRRRELRDNATREERMLWERLRRKQLGFRIYRQYSIGPYIADFYCPTKKLVIELDGLHHVDNYDYDLERTRYLEGLGIKAIRFWNDEVKKDIEQVVTTINKMLE